MALTNVSETFTDTLPREGSDESNFAVTATLTVLNPAEGTVSLMDVSSRTGHYGVTERHVEALIEWLDGEGLTVVHCVWGEMDYGTGAETARPI